MLDTMNMIKTSENIWQHTCHRFVEDLSQWQCHCIGWQDLSQWPCHCIEWHHTQNKLPRSTSGSEKTSKISNLQNDVRLFSIMFISSQARDSDLDAFFQHEKHYGLHSWHEMHPAKNKSVLVECLESLVPQQEGIIVSNVKIVYSSALVHVHNPKKSQIPIKTYKNYSHLMFLSYIRCVLLEVVCVVLMSTERIAWRHKLHGTVVLEINSRLTTHLFQRTGETSCALRWCNVLFPTPSKCHTGASASIWEETHLPPQSKCYIISNIRCLTKKPTHSFCFMPPICFITYYSIWYKQQVLVWFSQLLYVGHVSTLRYTPVTLLQLN